MKKLKLLRGKLLLRFFRDQLQLLLLLLLLLSFFFFFAAAIAAVVVPFLFF